MIQLGRLLADYTVNIPFLDDWSFVPMDEKRLGPGLDLHDFLAGHLEHRIAFTRVIIMLCHKFWPTDYTKQTWVSYAFLCLTYLNVCLLMRRTLREPMRRWWWLLALAGVSIFSPVQYQVFLWLCLHEVTDLLFFLTAGILVLTSRWPLWLRFVLAALCALCASLSFATGLLLWIVMTPVVLWSTPLKNARQRVPPVLLWIATFGVTLFLYFHDLKNEADPIFALGQEKTQTAGAALQAFVKDPLHSLEFVARVLGGHLARGVSVDLMTDAFWIGALLLVLYLAALAAVLRHFRDAELRARIMPWLALGAYSIGATTFVAMGRVWVTKTGLNALSGRYVVHAVPLMLAVPALGFILWREWRVKRPAWQAALDRSVLAAVVALVVAQTVGWNYGERLMQNLSASRRHCASCVLFYKTKDTTPHLVLEGDIDPVEELAKRADNLHMLRPPMLKSLRLDNFLTSSGPLSPNFAEWKSLRIEKAPGGSFRGLVDGTAWLHKRGRVADGIFLTWFDPSDKHWEIFHVTNVAAMPAYLKDAYVKDLEFTDFPGKSFHDSLTSFQATFDLSTLPQDKGPLKLAAWAYDQTGGDVALIPGAFEVDPAHGTVTALGDKREAVDFDDYVKRTGRKKAPAELTCRDGGVRRCVGLRALLFLQGQLGLVHFLRLDGIVARCAVVGGGMEHAAHGREDVVQQRHGFLRNGAGRLAGRKQRDNQADGEEAKESHRGRL